MIRNGNGNGGTNGNEPNIPKPPSVPIPKPKALAMSTTPMPTPPPPGPPQPQPRPDTPKPGWHRAGLPEARTWVDRIRVAALLVASGVAGGLLLVGWGVASVAILGATT